MHRRKRKPRYIEILRHLIPLSLVLIFALLIYACVPLQESSAIQGNSCIDTYERSNSDGQAASDKPISADNWELILVNARHKLPEDFSIELAELKNGHSVDKRIASDLQEMLDDMYSAGLSPVICSSYRTYEKQQTLFDNKVSKYISNGYSQTAAESKAREWVAAPGTSEHQTGLAVDIVALDYQILDEKQETTAEQQWLIKNSYKYGFILRYPSEKSQITGIGYEPWHYRYVGKNAAKEIYDMGICLEEYLD